MTQVCEPFGFMELTLLRSSIFRKDFRDHAGKETMKGQLRSSARASFYTKTTLVWVTRVRTALHHIPFPIPNTGSGPFSQVCCAPNARKPSDVLLSSAPPSPPDRSLTTVCPQSRGEFPRKFPVNRKNFADYRKTLRLCRVLTKGNRL